MRENVEALARKAKELVIGMQDRTGRNPDVADFVAAFRPFMLVALVQARLDGAFEELLAQAHAMQKNEICCNCGKRTLEVPF